MATSDGDSYSFDTSALMDWHARFYPPDIFPSLESHLVQLIAAGRLRAVQLVQEEVRAVGTPDLQHWIRSQKGLFVTMSVEIQRAGAEIERQYPDLMDERGLHESADAYVIAFARLTDGVVVTQETSAAEKRNPKKRHFIPDVCRDLGVTCVNLLGMMRREHWRI